MTEEQNIKPDAPRHGDAETLLADVEAALQKAPRDASLLIEKGKLLWRLGKRGEAMSAYEAAAAIEPDGAAPLLIEHSNAIMDFFNPDLLNP